MINSEGRIVAKLIPLRIEYPFPAGQSSCKNPDIFRSGLVISSAPLMKHAAGDWWNSPDSKIFSACPDPIVGWPCDTSKPRKGRWGETAGTTISRDSYELADYWLDYHSGVHRWMLDDVATLDAKKDLQKRIEICLYGKPRDTTVICHCPVDRSACKKSGLKSL
ncbi:hypothetical protein Btru_067564 [Bulinus truncatus]|nr:hypothetical protein Btru_067564 [Bulinus truncatus]